MANLLINKRRLITPRNYIIDYNNPINVGFHGGYFSALSKDNTGIDLRYGATCVKIGTQEPTGIYLKNSRFGTLITKAWPSSNQGHAVYTPTGIGTTESRTVLWLFQYSGAVSNTKIAQVGSSFPQPGLFFGYGGSRSIVTEMRMSDGNYKTLTSSFTPETDMIYVAATRVVPQSSMELFIEGTQDQTISLAGLNGYELAWHLYPCSQQAGVPQIPLIIVWKRALSNAEIYTISQNPFQLLKQVSPHNLYFDAPQAAVGSSKDIGGLIYLNKTIGGL